MAPDSSEQEAEQLCPPPTADQEFAFSPVAAAASAAASVAVAGLRTSLSPGEVRYLKAASRRQAAADWVTVQTGIEVPHESDAVFRQSLRDGVTLCRLLNTLHPGAVSKVIDGSLECTSPTGEVIQSFENVANFNSAVKQLTGGATTLSAADLEDAGDRPQVADCILALQAWWQVQQQQASGSQHPLRNSVSWSGIGRAAAADAAAAAWRPPSPGKAVSSPSKATLSPAPAPAAPALEAAAPCPAAAGGSTPMLLRPLPRTPCSAAHQSPTGPVPPSAGQTTPVAIPAPGPAHGASPAPVEFSFTPHAATAVHRAAGQQRTDGLEYLMRTCNHMLKNSMGMPATPLPPPPRTAAGIPPEIALDAVGPVLESVLQNLTAEYEKRLLAKDQEFKLSQEAQERMRREIARLKQEVAHWKEQAAAVKFLPAPENEVSAAERAAYEEQLRAKEAEAAAEVARKEAELQRVAQEAAQQVAEADQRLGELSAEVESYRGIEERYRQMVDENRQLYNTVQDLRGNIRVFCRVRPSGLTGDKSARMVELGEEGTVSVFSHKHNKWHLFKFDKVFGEDSTQNDVYCETQPLIRSVLDGYNVCIFAYGQTGSGKTHTMSGTDIDEYANRGINYRALDDLFELNRQRASEVEYSISVQLLEIYNEMLRDLLVDSKEQRSLQLINTQGSGFNVPEAIQVPVSCTEDVLEVMERGSRNRAVAGTKMNERSSRSHQVLTVIVEGSNKITHARSHGCLHLIDLAGSERVGKSGAEGQQMLEAQHINKSLSALGNVMHALASKSTHVPFRDSKLTQLLQDSLSGQAKTMMFMHVAPEMTSVSETLSTLNFGKGVTEITLGAAKKNAESGAVFEAKERAMKLERDAAAATRALAAEQERNAELQAEIDSLRAMLARAADSPSASEDEGSIRAYRPAASRHVEAAGPAGQAGSNGGGVTPRSRLSLGSLPLPAGGSGTGGSSTGGRLTPRGSAGVSGGGSRGLTPRGGVSGGGTTLRGGPVSSRPPQVSRLNLSASGLGGNAKSALLPAVDTDKEERRLSGPSTRPPPPALAKLNLQKLNLQRSETEENKTPLSARVSPLAPYSSRSLPAAAAAGSACRVGNGGGTTPRASGITPRGGGTTPRGGATTPRSPANSTNWLLEDDSGSDSDALSGPAREGAEGADAGADALQLSMSPPRIASSRRTAASSSMAPGAVAAVPRLALFAGSRLQQPPPALGDRQSQLRANAMAGSRLPQGPGSRIPGPSPTADAAAAAPSGSLTARPSTKRSPGLSGATAVRAPMSARESPAEAAARRASLQQKTGIGSGAGASLRRFVAAPEGAGRVLNGSSSMRRSISGSSDTSSASGTLNSARGVRSSLQAPPTSARRWA